MHIKRATIGGQIKARLWPHLLCNSDLARVNLLRNISREEPYLDGWLPSQVATPNDLITMFIGPSASRPAYRALCRGAPTIYGCVTLFIIA